MLITNPTTSCPFCSPAPGQVWAENGYARAFFDAYPVADGHTLVVPVRHAPSIFDASNREYTALWALVATVRRRLQLTHDARAVNIGVNDGGAAGQTVAHAHIHVIPRHPGDVPDPRGGIRWVLPDRARYWSD